MSGRNDLEVERQSEIRALNEEWHRSETMHISVYNKRLDEIDQRARERRNAPALHAPKPEPQPTGQFVTVKVFMGVCKIIGEQVRAAIDRTLDPIKTRLATVEMRTGALALLAGQGKSAENISEVESLLARVKALEARSVGMTYCGVWREGNEYGEGAVVTDHGSAWHCNRKTTARPGSNGDFTLMVKRGADAR